MSFFYQLLSLEARFTISFIVLLKTRIGLSSIDTVFIKFKKIKKDEKEKCIMHDVYHPIPDGTGLVPSVLGILSDISFVMDVPPSLP